MQTSCTGIELCTYTVRRTPRTVTGSPPRINVLYTLSDVRTVHSKTHSAVHPQRHAGAWESKNLWPPRKRHGGCSFSVFTRQGGSPVVDMKAGASWSTKPTRPWRCRYGCCMARPGSVRTRAAPARGWLAGGGEEGSRAHVWEGAARNLPSPCLHRIGPWI